MKQLHYNLGPVCVYVNRLPAFGLLTVDVCHNSRGNQLITQKTFTNLFKALEYIREVKAW